MAAMSLATEEELQAAQQSRPELFARLQLARNEAASSSTAQSSSSAAPAAAPALQPVMLPSFGGMAPQFGLVQMSAPFGGCLMPAPGPPPLDAADAAPQSKAASKASAQALHEASNFAVPIRGRDVPHPQRGRSHSRAQPCVLPDSRGYYDAPSGVIWHQDRAGNT